MRLTFLKEYNFGLSEVVKCNKILRFCEKQNYLKSNKNSTRTLILKEVTVTQSALENRKDMHCNSIHKDIFQPKIGREVKPWPKGLFSDLCFNGRHSTCVDLGWVAKR